MPKKPVPEEKVPVPVAKKKEVPPAKGTVTYLVKKLKKQKQKTACFTISVRTVFVLNYLLI